MTDILRDLPPQRDFTEGASSTGHMPFLRPDETIFSWLSRYGEPFNPKRPPDSLRGFRSASSAILKALFGRRGHTLFQEHPKGIGELAAKVPGGYWSHDVLIDDHTPLPYYSRFLSADQYAVLRSSMVNGLRYSSRKGVMQKPGGQSRASTLVYCNECVAADLSDGEGIPSWRRLHQLPGMFMCLKHGTVLNASNVPASNNRQLTCCPGTAAGQDRRLPFAPALARRLAEDTEWLLANPGPQHGAAPFKAAMQDLLQEYGLKRHGKLSPELGSMIDTTFGCSGLETIGIRPTNSRWYRILLNRGGAEQPGAPLRWLVLLAAVGVRLNDFLPMVDRAAACLPEGPSVPQLAQAKRQPPRNTRKNPRRADGEVVTALQTAARRLIEEPGWPTRATAYKLQKLVGITHIRAGFRRSHPLAAAMLAELVESDHEIAGRRLLFLARRALQDGTCPTFTKFARNTYPERHPRRDEFKAMAHRMHEAIVAATATVPASEARSVFERLAAAAVGEHAGPPTAATKSGQVKRTPG